MIPASPSTSPTISRMASRRPASSAENGSSSSISCGRRASARASATRCCWPPESSCGRRSSIERAGRHGRSARRCGAARSGVAAGEAEADVVGDAQMRKQRAVLRHDSRCRAGAAARLAWRRRARRRQRDACRRPASRSPAMSAQQRGLAGAGRADDGGAAAGAASRVDAGERRHVAVALVTARRSRGSSSCRHPVGLDACSSRTSGSDRTIISTA